MSAPSVVEINGELNLASVAHWEAQVHRASERSQVVVLDATQVEFLDSAGVHSLFRLVDTLHRRGKRLVLVAPPGCRARRVLDILELPSLAAIYSSSDEALQAAGRGFRGPRSGYPSVMRVLVLSPVAVTDQQIRGALGSAATDEVKVVVPVVEQSRLAWLTNDDGDARATAEAAVSTTERATGANVRADVGDESPAQAVEDALRTFDADEIVVLVRPDNDESWLETGAARRIVERIGDLPVRAVDLPSPIRRHEMSSEGDSQFVAPSTTGSDPAPPDVPAPPAPDPAPVPRPGDPVPEHPLERSNTDVTEAQERLAGGPTSEREPTGQTGSASEQYAGAGTTPDAAPELERRDLEERSLADLLPDRPAQELPAGGTGAAA